MTESATTAAEKGDTGAAPHASAQLPAVPEPRGLSSLRVPAWMTQLACLAVLLYVAALAIRPLNANDLFWHLATGRQILATGSIPREDPFSFGSDGGPWIDHEWLWQVGAQAVYALTDGSAAARPGPPDTRGELALIVAGAAIVLAAFGLGLAGLIRDRTPAAIIVVFGLIAAEAARERLMFRPETASLLFLASLLTVLGRGSAGPRRAMLLAAITALWADVHPAALLAPVIVFLDGVGKRFGTGLAWSIPRRTSSGSTTSTPAAGAESNGESRSSPPMEPPKAEANGARLSMVLLEATLAALAVCANPYGPRLWGVPFMVSGLIQTKRYFNPEWLRPPIEAFPLFYAGVVLVLAAALAATLRTRRPPPAPLITALLLGALGLQQMRHLALFGVAFLFAGGAVLKSLDPKGISSAILGRPWIPASICGLAVILAAPASLGIWSRAEGLLDGHRFPVEACERIAVFAPGMRLYNDVQFGGYLIWRFFPERKVFIDGRNEIYTKLLPRLGRIHTGEAPYSDWRNLIREHGIEGAVVRYEPNMKGVLYPPASPGGEPVRGYRAWSAFLFPTEEWALVYFDDTALVFMKRGGRGEAWIHASEYRYLNPEDSQYLVERARQDPAFASHLRAEARRRLTESPTCLRATRLLADLGE